MNIVCEIKPNIDVLMKTLRGDATGARKAGMLNLVATLEALAVKDAPKRTSNLARTRTSDVSDDGARGIIRFTAPYAGFVHEGTGLFGPRHRRITPTGKRALFWPGAKHPVKSTAGMKGRPWVRKAADKVDASAVYEEGMQNYLSQRGY